MTKETMTGAEALVETLADCGVTACFANPGTSEMNLVTALDGEQRIRSVLCLFEGVATGAADGFARIAETPAMTLLHLGPGYLNGGANIHNAKRAGTPMVNVIGDHATYHLRYDAPLASNIIGLAGPNSVWIKTAETAEGAGALAAEAFEASLGAGSGPVSLVLPADAAWNEGGARATPRAKPVRRKVSDAAISAAAERIRSASKPMLLTNGAGLLDEGLASLAKLEAAGVRTMSDTFVGRQARGAGRFTPARMQYFAEGAMKDLDGTDLMITAGTGEPVAFFAYPEKPSRLVPEGCVVLDLGGRDSDVVDTLGRLAKALAAEAAVDGMPRKAPDVPSGALTPSTVGQSLNRHMPKDTMVADDGVTASLPVFLETLTAEPHDWMMLTGGAIGMGMPLAIGASIARPDVPTVCLTGDGAGMYTVQALWTMARERLPVVTIVFVNHSYRILNIELARTGAGNPGPAAKNMLTLGNPEIDWVALGLGQGVPSFNARDAGEFDRVLAEALASDGPTLIAAHIDG